MNNNKEEKKSDTPINNIISPDFKAMAQADSTSSILEGFTKIILSSKMKYDWENISRLIKAAAFILSLRNIMNFTGSYLDALKITDTKLVKYYIQRCRYSHITHNILLVDNKWYFDDIEINRTSLKTYFERYAIYLEKFGKYYHNIDGFLCLVKVSDTQISITIPKISRVQNKYHENIINANKSIIFGKLTQMYRVICKMSSLTTETVSLSEAFETKNYLLFKEGIMNKMSIDVVFGQNTNIPYCVNFNGPPGVGKSTFPLYIAPSGIFDCIFIINMSNAWSIQNDLEKNIARLQDTVNQKINMGANSNDINKRTKVLLIIDEIDKWLDSYIDKQIKSIKNKAAETSIQKPTKDGKKETVTKESRIISKEEENEERKMMKKTFLDQLYNLVDGSLLASDKRYVIVFNTNHFDSMFYDCEPKHDATRKRIEEFQFNMIKKDDIVNYVDNAIKKSVEFNKNSAIIKNATKHDLKVANEIADNDITLLDNIPNDFETDYRTLNRIGSHCMYNVTKMVDHITELYQENKLKLNQSVDEVKPIENKPLKNHDEMNCEELIDDLVDNDPFSH